MNWRRGILLAGIHLAVAAPLIVMRESQDEANMREYYAQAAQAPAQSDSGATSHDDQETTFGFDPCAMFIDYTTRYLVEHSLEPFAVALSGWQQACPAHWSLAGLLKVNQSFVGASTAIRSLRKVACGYCLLVAIQWILVGAFPLIQPKRRWLEPGAFITCCTVVAFGLVFIRSVEELARIPVLLAAFAWLWWFGLLVWTGVRFGWKRMIRNSS